MSKTNGRAVKGDVADGAAQAAGPAGRANGQARKLSQREIEQFQEILIRAHYLAMELTGLCAPSGIGRPEASDHAAITLKHWALEFARELRESCTAQVRAAPAEPRPLARPAERDSP